jgi:hypothetical protein
MRTTSEATAWRLWAEPWLHPSRKARHLASGQASRASLVRTPGGRLANGSYDQRVRVAWCASRVAAESCASGGRSPPCQY